MAGLDYLPIGTDTPLKLTGVRDVESGTYLNAATVRAVVKDAAGAEVAGQPWPLTLSYQDGSNGDYAGLLEDGLELAEGAYYYIEITVDAGGDLIAFYRLRRSARYRTDFEP